MAGDVRRGGWRRDGASKEAARRRATSPLERPFVNAQTRMLAEGSLGISSRTMGDHSQVVRCLPSDMIARVSAVAIADPILI
jgi:hypothetical protein